MAGVVVDADNAGTTVVTEVLEMLVAGRALLGVSFASGFPAF